MSPVLLARCCFGYRGGIVHVHVGKPQIVELLIQLFLTVNSVSYGGNPFLSEHHPPVLLSGSTLPCAIEWTPPYPYSLQ